MLYLLHALHVVDALYAAQFVHQAIELAEVDGFDDEVAPFATVVL